MNKKISIIIPSWFEKNQHGHYGQNETFVIADITLNRLLETIKDRNDIELIIIDNGSTLKINDLEQKDKVQQYFNKADILIRNKENKGFGPAVNQGIARASGEYIIQINNDVLVFPNWLNAIFNVYEREKELSRPIGMVMPNIIKKEYQKNCLNERARLDFNKVFALKEEEVVLHHKEIIEPHAQFGSLWCIKKELVDRIVKEDRFFFDEQFEKAFKEDRDIYQRLYLRGFDTYRTNLSRVYHVGNLTVTKLKDRKQYTDANKEKYEKKWRGKEM